MLLFIPKYQPEKAVSQRGFSWMILCVTIFLCLFAWAPELGGGNSMGLAMSLYISAGGGSLRALFHILECLQL